MISRILSRTKPRWGHQRHPLFASDRHLVASATKASHGNAGDHVDNQRRGKAAFQYLKENSIRQPRWGHQRHPLFASDRHLVASATKASHGNAGDHVDNQRRGKAAFQYLKENSIRQPRWGHQRHPLFASDRHLVASATKASHGNAGDHVDNQRRGKAAFQYLKENSIRQPRWGHQRHPLFASDRHLVASATKASHGNAGDHVDNQRRGKAAFQYLKENSIRQPRWGHQRHPLFASDRHLVASATKASHGNAGDHVDNQRRGKAAFQYLKENSIRQPRWGHQRHPLFASDRHLVASATKASHGNAGDHVDNQRRGKAAFQYLKENSIRQLN